uniref:C2H2-type domain-containing protein n=1 Tax=Mola mola TaxID=94237 RepID=A0A3Q3X5X7_MOLML
MWQVAWHQNVKHYGMLEDFVSLVTEAVPQLLTDRQRSLLLLALRAKVSAQIRWTDSDSCRSVLQSLKSFLSNRYSWLQDVFNQSFDSALQDLISDFLSRIEQLFPVPDFKQVLSDPPPTCNLIRSAVSHDTEKILLSAWSHPLLTKLTNRDPSPTDVEVQSDPLLDVVTPIQLDVELVKVEMMVMTEDEQGEEEETGIDSSSSFFPCSEVTANALYSISHNSQRVAHKCPQCGKCFIYRSQVIPLTTTGTVNLTHTCFQCNAVFKNKTELLSHQRIHRARTIYQCDLCDKEFHHLSSLSNHKQTHLDRGGFSCSRCEKVFESAKERDAHRLQHRLPDLTCTVCNQTFSSQTPLLRHLQTHSVEGAEPCYNCRFCDQTFSVTQLRIHQRTHTFRSYQCDQCSKTYSSLTGLHSHQASHTNESRFLCPQCGKRFKTRDGLEGHLRTHTGERPYRCPYCPKDFTALAGLNVHVRRHTGERPYVCTVCGKGWPSGGDLQKHMRTHTGERPYVCQDCGKAFSISCHLTEHRRIHTGEKPFSCPECGKCLRRKFDLKKHMLSHSSIRPYACVYCPKSYTRKTHLNRHLLTHRTLACSVSFTSHPAGR